LEVLRDLAHRVLAVVGIIEYSPGQTVVHSRIMSAVYFFELCLGYHRLSEGKLPAEYLPHLLHGNRRGQWECHIQPDWLLIWEQHDQELILVMLNTGTHADLFDKRYRR
jgi:hypothetical protein